MMRFVDQIHQAFHETVRSGSLVGVADLPRRLRVWGAPPDTRDQMWTQVLRDYVNGPRAAWATIILEAMCPDLVITIAAMPAMPPAITHDEVAQQLITELLAAVTPNQTKDGKTSLAQFTVDDKVRDAVGERVNDLLAAHPLYPSLKF